MNVVVKAADKVAFLIFVSILIPACSTAKQKQFRGLGGLCVAVYVICMPQLMANVSWVQTRGAFTLVLFGPL